MSPGVKFAVGSVLFLPITQLSLGMLGFGGAGVAGGSIGAWIQSQIGNVAANSVFAGIQSLGTVGFISLNNLFGAGFTGFGLGTFFETWLEANSTNVTQNVTSGPS